MNKRQLVGIFYIIAKKKKKSGTALPFVLKWIFA
jgi:hypothetical protein